MVNHRKSWAGNVFVWLDLTLDPFFNVEQGYCICSTIKLQTLVSQLLHLFWKKGKIFFFTFKHKNNVIPQ